MSKCAHVLNRRRAWKASTAFGPSALLGAKLLCAALHKGRAPAEIRALAVRAVRVHGFDGGQSALEVCLHCGQLSLERIGTPGVFLHGGQPASGHMRSRTLFDTSNVYESLYVTLNISARSGSSILQMAPVRTSDLPTL